MGNKVINIGGTTEQKDSYSGTYLDINMISKQKKLNDGSEKYSIDKSVDEHAVWNSLHNIFTWIPGERVINPEFGSRLRELLYEGINKFTEEQVIAEIKGSVQRWEPRVVIDKVVNISRDEFETEDNTMELDIIYHIIGLEDRPQTYQYFYRVNGNR